MAELIKEFLVFGIFIIFLKVLLIMFSVTKSIFTYVTYFKVVLTDHVSSYFDLSCAIEATQFTIQCVNCVQR